MGVLRLFVEVESSARATGDRVEAPLDPASAHHAHRVRRLSAGAVVEVVEPSGRVLTVTLESAPSAVLSGTVTSIAEPRQGPRIALFQGMPKGDKLDLVVAKATEIGVDTVVPVIFERSVVDLSAPKRAARGERLRRVALAAAKQSRRDSVPTVIDPVDLAEAIPMLAEYDTVLLALEDGLVTRVDAALSGDAGCDSVAIVVGPEGGFADRELERLLATGATPVTLGPNILRTETAGIVASAIIAYHLYGLRPGDETSAEIEIVGE
ncbi:MAG: 16S rRNA (uracil(1498)-N(3))-methyltransferase [Actinobacteria bacterium]|nr:16S rRNA (uracil(1498)-N(3))-methyltransferase [Actinomycetota bacterium]MCL5887858.1 16S rRNA (uracil(1498)-N(3))-methyltransferase [Actinomycetota bacterium]